MCVFECAGVNIGKQLLAVNDRNKHVKTFQRDFLDSVINRLNKVLKYSCNRIERINWLLVFKCNGQTPKRQCFQRTLTQRIGILFPLVTKVDLLVF